MYTVHIKHARYAFCLEYTSILSSKVKKMKTVASDDINDKYILYKAWTIQDKVSAL
jgi:hypothetical protein